MNPNDCSDSQRFTMLPFISTMGIKLMLVNGCFLPCAAWIMPGQLNLFDPISEHEKFGI
jgi:hypothetical protein